MSGRFIVLEGLDCVGKSTIAELLAKRLNGVYVSTPPQSFLAECRQIDRNGVVFQYRSQVVNMTALGNS